MPPTQNTDPNKPRIIDPRIVDSNSRYWKANIKITAVLLSIWAVVGLGCGILFADTLNQIQIPGTGFRVGFWVAQQGSIIVFVLLVLAYAIFMNKLDKKHNDELKQIKKNIKLEGK